MILKLRLVIVLLGAVFIGLGSQAVYAQNLGPQKTAVIAVKFCTPDPITGVCTPDPDPYTLEQIQNIVFNADNRDSLNAYVIEVSYGQSSITGGESSKTGTTSNDVFGWYTLNMDSSTCDFVGGKETVLPIIDGNGFTTHVLAAAIAAAYRDINFSDYSRIILFQPWVVGCGGPRGTIGTVRVNIDDVVGGEIRYFINASVLWPNSGGLVGVWQKELDGVQSLNDAEFGHLLRHEAGHNFGLPHARSYECGAKAFSDSGCSTLIDGPGSITNPFDSVSNGPISFAYSPHYNAYSKEKIGWLNSTNVLNVTKSGTYTILPLESPPLESISGQYKAIKIPRPNNPTQEAFYIEYRQKIGYDATFDTYLDPLKHNAYDGALIHYVPSLQKADSVLIDATPETLFSSSDPSMDFRDAALTLNKTFTDGAGISVTTIAVLPDTALMVQVKLPCTQDYPISLVTTDGSGESATVNATLKLEFTGNIASLSVGSKVTTLKVCRGTILNYKATATVGTPVCTIDNRVVFPQGKIQVDSLRKLYCTNTQGGGSDKDSFSISPI